MPTETTLRESDPSSHVDSNRVAESTPAPPAESTESVAMRTVVARIRRDSRSAVDAYLQETEVPHGGE